MMQKAYFSDFISNFLKLSPDEILGVLADANQFSLELEQRNAWQTQISILKFELIGFVQGAIYFEFSIPRMGKRADVVILSRGVIYVIEFKVGSDQFYGADVRQAHDYALDLKNFHKGSHHLPIVPILIATEAKRQPITKLRRADDHVADPILCGGAGLIDILTMVDQEIGNDRVRDDDWIGSGYLPTPTIIEAAQALYQNHDVDEISRSDAGAKNLNLTTVGLRQIIHDSAQNNQKSICFVTGVPGSGKTLVGLNIATDQAMKVDGEAAVFLSGNGPLVCVLREALARDQKKRTGCSKTDAVREVSSFVQNIHHFRDEALRDLQPTAEHVVVFDEAQRAWNKDQASKFMKAKRGQDDFDQSEPEFLVSVMDRHQDWCVIVCLVGGGQEINTGEAGLSEWMRAFEHRFDDWQLYLSNRLKDSHYGLAHMAPELEKDGRVSWNDNLHLGVSMRSFRAETLSNFVAEIIDNKQDAAKEMFKTLKERYPTVLTRDLVQAKTWLRKSARGNERFGLLASSGANRLRPEGLNVKAKVDAVHWFLNDQNDVRSAYYLEEVATEFDVQGLELDWAGVCWDADFRYGENGWEHYNFSGTKWQNVNKATRQKYLENAYRVILTRARQGMVIYVPKGDNNDSTRPPNFYDGIAQFLTGCGIPEI